MAGCGLVEVWRFWLISNDPLKRRKQIKDPSKWRGRANPPVLFTDSFRGFRSSHEARLPGCTIH